MKSLLALILFSSVCFSQDTLRVHVQSGQIISLPPSVKFVIATVDPETVRTSSTTIDSLFDWLKMQVPRMETADNHSWVALDKLSGVTLTRYFSGSFTDQEAIDLVRSGAVILYMGTKSTTTLKTPLRGYRP